MIRKVAISSSSQIAADAGARVAAEGGNAVDAAIAAVLVQLITEPGVVSLAAGGFVTIWSPDGGAVTIDGGSEMPGRNLPAERFGHGAQTVYLEYGGGMHTTVGYGSIGSPGALAAFGLASERYGLAPWHSLVEPAFEHARDGFALSQASYNYLLHTHDGIFGWNPQSFAALHDEKGELKRVGESVVIEHLDQSLRAIADRGPEEFYRGELAKRIVDDVQSHGGILTLGDLEAYEARILPALEVGLDDWHVASSPPPSVGGASLAAMLLLMRGRPYERWTSDEAAHLIRVQKSVMEYRRNRLDRSDDLFADVRELLDRASEGGLLHNLQAPSTVHTSAVDSSGLACSITASAGYGSGAMPPGTGIWLNNCLGELELNKKGFHAVPPGTRIPSNMAPTVARRNDGAILAVGSPGADRITTAILQTIVNFAHLGMLLPEAVSHPRLHVEFIDDTSRVAYEPGLPVDDLDVPQRRFDGLNMFFGGVSAAFWEPPEHFVLAADPRRTGGTAVASDGS